MKFKTFDTVKEELFKLPNELTLLRIFLTPIVLVAIVYGKNNWAFFIYAVAAITDFFDGYVARKRKEITDIGKFLDPLADKLMSLTMYISLSIKALHLYNTIPTWLTIFVVSRDLFIMFGIGIIFLLKDDIIIKVTIWGKIAMVLQDLTVFFVLLFNYLKRSCIFIDYLYVLTLAFVLISTYGYVKMGFKVIGENGGNNV